MTTYDYLLQKYGPALTANQTAKLLNRSPKGLQKSARNKSNPLRGARRKIGRRIYFSAVIIAELIDGQGLE